MRRIGAAVVVLMASVTVAVAAEADCNGYPSLSGKPVLAIGRITAASPRINFVKNASDQANCPAATDVCRGRGFLVPGDTVIAGTASGAFTCVDYINAKGEERAGWMPTASIERQPPTPVSMDDWVGPWVRDREASVTVTKASTGLKITGDATYGALDPGRVKRGAVNVGAIAGTVTPTGSDLAFAMAADDKTVSVDKGDEYDCKVWMRRLGPYLLVDDNNDCGGMNVSFRGAYRRK